MIDELDNRPLLFFVCTEELDEDSDIWHCRNAVLEQYVFDRAILERELEPNPQKNIWWIDAN